MESRSTASDPLVIPIWQRGQSPLSKQPQNVIEARQKRFRRGLMLSIGKKPGAAEVNNQLILDAYELHQRNRTA